MPFHLPTTPLQMRSQMVLSAEDEEVLWWVLLRHAAPGAGATACSGSSSSGAAQEGGTGGAASEPEPCLNYDDFTQASSQAGGWAPGGWLCNAASAVSLYWEGCGLHALVRQGLAPGRSEQASCVGASGMVQSHALAHA